MRMEIIHVFIHTEINNKKMYLHSIIHSIEKMQSFCNKKRNQKEKKMEILFFNYKTNISTKSNGKIYIRELLHYTQSLHVLHHKSLYSICSRNLLPFTPDTFDTRHLQLFAPKHPLRQNAFCTKQLSY